MTPESPRLAPPPAEAAPTVGDGSAERRRDEPRVPKERVGHVRLTRGQHQFIRESARAFGLSTSEFIRARTLREPLPRARRHRPLPELSHKAYNELSHALGSLHGIHTSLKNLAAGMPGSVQTGAVFHQLRRIEDAVQEARRDIACREGGTQ